MSLTLTSRKYYINSERRLEGTSSSFTYEIIIPPQEKYDHVCVLQASIPLSYYLVEDGEYITLREGATDANIFIPAGNYSASSFVTIVKPLINAASPNGWVYNMTIPNSFLSPSTGLFTWTVTGHTSEPAFIFDNTDLHRPFGFSQNTTNTFVSGSLTSTNVVLFIPETTVFIHSDIANNGQNDMLQEIYSDNTVPFSNIVYKCTSVEGYSKKLTTRDNNVFKFNLTDKHGHTLNFHGQDVLITLILYRKDDLMMQFLRYIQTQANYNSQQLEE